MPFVKKTPLLPFGGGSRCRTLGLGGWSVDTPTIDPWLSGKAGGCDPRRWPVAHHQRFGKNVSPKGSLVETVDFSDFRILRVGFSFLPF